MIHGLTLPPRPFRPTAALTLFTGAILALGLFPGV